MLDALRALCPGVRMPPPAHIKLLNWQTAQVKRAAPSQEAGCVSVRAGGDGAKSGGGAKSAPGGAQGGVLVVTGDWLVESSFEGCAVAASAATAAVARALKLDS